MAQYKIFKIKDWLKVKTAMANEKLGSLILPMTKSTCQLFYLDYKYDENIKN